MREQEFNREELEGAVVIDTKELSEYIYYSLIQRGFAPTEKDCYEIADILFDYLVDKRVIDEVIEEDEDW